MLERAPQPVHAPGRYYVKVLPCDTLDEPGKGRTPILGSADALVRKDPSNLPPVAGGDGLKFALLVFDRLPVGANPHVDRCPFRLAHTN